MPYILNWVDWSMINYNNKNYDISLPSRKGLKQRLQRSSIDMCIIRHVTDNGVTVVTNLPFSWKI